MSRRLPARPNLEHLRKQARELLEELRRKDSALRLSDAQHALAREYGFASWPKLKAHVDLQAVEQTSRTRPLAGQWR
jgi:hypothetical protein